MSTHRTSRRSAVTSTRVRALLGLGVALGVGASGTLAAWTDDVVISGTAFTAGTLDLQVNDSDSYATTTLGMAAMVPGNTSAQVLTIKNNGTAALKYSLTGGLAGTDAALYNSSAALTLTIRAGGTRSGAVNNAATCTGGTQIYSAALTNVASTAIIPTSARRGPLAAAGTETLCFQVSFDANAATGLQNKTATATFTASGTSDVS